ncbi:MAG: TonB-dependent receptor [Bacteroidales bacterium]|nr:TonB-dependent receptor [Bacteroidales bacterium]
MKIKLHTIKKTIFRKTLLMSFFMLLFTTLQVNAQTQVTGIVTDIDGLPLPGVNVVIKGTNIGVITDIDGKYTIQVDNGDQVLQFSFVGYVTREIAVGDQTAMNIVLEEDIKTFDEVVVIGYGVQKKSDLTGSVASIKSEDLASSLNASLEQAMQGRAAGVQISSTTGAPGSNVNVNIRGMASINGSNPLWIVDGIYADPKTVNISDIESIEILKDASAAAIYGANGGSGVVLITTKKGKTGKPQVNFNMTFSRQSFDNFVELASGPEFGHMYTEYDALLRRRWNRYYFNGENAPLPDSLSNYDYQNEIFRKAPQKEYNLNISGGTEKTTYYLGLGYVDQEGILRNSGYKRLSIRVNAENKANEWFSMGENLSATREEYSGFEEWQYLNEYATPILQALNYHPFVPFYIDTLGNPASSKTPFTNWSATPLGNTNNPVSTVELLDRKRTKNAIKATVFAKIEPIKGLTFESRISGDFSNDFTNQFYPIFLITPSYRNDNTKIYKYYGNYYGYTLQDLLTYQKTIFNDHNFSILAGYEVGYNKYEWIDGTRWDLINASKEMQYFNASTNDTLVAQIPFGDATETSGISYLGRFNYDYKGMILAQFNFRRDGSSIFAEGKRWGNFPSYSFGFKFTELGVVKDNLPFLSFGKIRYAHGKTGNNAIRVYSQYSVVSTQLVYNYSFNHTASASTGAAPTRMGNNVLAWEDVITNNIGLDLGFLNNKFTFTTEYFKRYNDGMLMEKELLGEAGYIVRAEFQEGGSSKPVANIGRLSNEGVEFTAEWKEKRGKFSYSVNANIAFIKTLAIDLEGDTLEAGTTKGVSSYLNKTIEGQPIGEFYGYQIEGLFTLEDADSINGTRIITNQPYVIDTTTGDPVYAQPDAQPGDFKFKDVNGDGIIDEKDIVPIGNPNPKFMYGFGINLQYGIFDFSMFFQGVYGNKIFNATKFYMYNMDGGFNWSKEYVQNHFREDIYNRDGELLYPARLDGSLPRLDPFNKNGNFSKVSDFYIEDGSYLRLKNITLGVSLPNKITQKLGIEKFRVYVSGSNLLTFTKYSGYDPEIGSKYAGDPNNITKEEATTLGLDKGAYPHAKMYSAGLNLTF